MRKTIAFIVFAIAGALPLFIFGNRQIINTTYTYDKAIIQTASGVIEGNVDSWVDYRGIDRIQITFEDGTTYLAHSSNVTLIKGE